MIRLAGGSGAPEGWILGYPVGGNGPPSRRRGQADRALEPGTDGHGGREVPVRFRWEIRRDPSWEAGPSNLSGSRRVALHGLLRSPGDRRVDAEPDSSGRRLPGDRGTRPADRHPRDQRNVPSGADAAAPTSIGCSRTITWTSTSGRRCAIGRRGRSPATVLPKRRSPPWRRS